MILSVATTILADAQDIFPWINKYVSFMYSAELKLRILSYGFKVIFM
jgi:hypothetical protein